MSARGASPSKESSERAVRPCSAGPIVSRHAAVRDELEFHFAETLDELREAGWSDEEARAEAQRRFGDLAATVRSLDALQPTGTKTAQFRPRQDQMETIIDVATTAVRSLVRRPLLSLAIILLLGVGLGATAVTFGLVDRLLIRPPIGVGTAPCCGQESASNSWTMLSTVNPKCSPSAAPGADAPKVRCATMPPSRPT